LSVSKAAKLAPLNSDRPQTDRKPKEKRWQEILQAATEVFYEKGYDAATLQDIADRVGILKGSIYYYIKTKGDLLEHLLADAHANGIAALRERAQTPGNEFEKLDAMIRRQIDAVCRQQIKTTVYLRELKSIPLDKRKSLIGMHEFRDEFRAILKEGQAKGLILSDLDATLTAQALVSSINSLYQWYKPHPRRPIGRIADHFATILLRGIATRAGQKLLPAPPKAGGRASTVSA